MDAQRIETIKQELIFRETQDLIDIWVRHDRDAWTDEAFEAVRQILLAELGYLPSYDQPEEAVNHLVRVQEHLSLDAPEKALEECELAIQSDPHNSAAYNARGMIYDDLGMLELAVESYQESLRLDPENKDARANLKYAMKEMGESRAPAKMQALNYWNLITSSWRILWTSKYPALLFLAFIALSSLTTLIKNELVLILLITPIILWVFELVKAAIILMIHNHLLNKLAPLSRIWKDSWRAGWNILILNYASLFIIIPIMLIAFAIILFLNRYTPIAMVLIIPISLIIILISPLFQLAEIDIVAKRSLPHEGFLNGFRMLIKRIDKIIILEVIVSLIAFFFVGSCFAAAIHLHKIPFRLDGELFKNFAELLNTPTSLIIFGMIQAILFTWSYSLMIVLYQWINQNEEAQYPQVV